MLQQPSYTRQELDAMFNVVNPPLMQLPQGNMRMIDRVTEVSAQGGRYGKGYLKAEFDIVPEHWFFACHFPGDPVMPGCLGLDALWQGLGFFLAWSGYEGKGRALGVGTVKFFGEVLPSACQVEYRLHIKRVLTREIALGIADGEVWVDGQQIYTAESLRTGLIPAVPQRTM
ncbi:MAG: bifunctional 3-hydroxydecanoyl-ACP dehydratase/trans-2-decenoyl-ACP isomerase [Hahellaceae bacterium]|nr:bifunctional 3-hydroxydecanoyl-ACP dehydratase/trans-2-decenoyl-ACP isomerase [Hahellaceae bacterium]